MKFSKNGNQYYSGTFVLKQNIKPKKVPDYKQFDSTSATDDYDEDCYFDDPHYSHRCTGSPNENYFTIQRKGCYLSSIANVLSYFGISTNPGTLNTGLNALPNGFAGAGNVNPDGVQQYAANNNVQVTNNFQAPSDLSTLVCQDGPQLLGVNCNANGYPTHWVTIYGYDPDMGTWLIHDPGHSDPPYLSARWRSYCAVRAYQGPEHQAPGPGHMYFVFHSPVELVLSDSSGRSVGASATSSVNALPYAYYDAGGLTDDYDGTPDLDPTKMIYVAQPASDQYTLSATGTADGSYSAEFEIFDGNGGKTESTFVNVPISSGAAQKFAINYDSTGQTPIQVYGAFTGNLLPISDSNKFLTYASPSAALTLVSGTTAPAVIFYDSTVVSSTFSATLNGKDVSALFHPQPGTHETVMVPLQTGQNVLTLSIVGNLPSGPATDSDSLVFVLTN